MVLIPRRGYSVVQRTDSGPLHVADEISLHWTRRGAGRVARREQRRHARHIRKANVDPRVCVAVTFQVTSRSR